MNGFEELALVDAHSIRVNALNQFRVLIDEPRFSQYVCSRVLELSARKHTLQYRECLVKLFGNYF